MSPTRSPLRRNSAWTETPCASGVVTTLAIVLRGKSTAQCSGSNLLTCVLTIGASALVNQCFIAAPPAPNGSRARLGGSTDDALAAPQGAVFRLRLRPARRAG